MCFIVYSAESLCESERWLHARMPGGRWEGSLWLQGWLHAGWRRTNLRRYIHVCTDWLQLYESLRDCISVGIFKSDEEWCISLAGGVGGSVLQFLLNLDTNALTNYNAKILSDFKMNLKEARNLNVISYYYFVNTKLHFKKAWPNSTLNWKLGFSIQTYAPFKCNWCCFYLKFYCLICKIQL